MFYHEEGPGVLGAGRRRGQQGLHHDLAGPGRLSSGRGRVGECGSAAKVMAADPPVRGVAALSGLALMTASALTRFGVLEAGIHSAKDPRYTIEPQKRRLAARREVGITDDSITTA